jgi:peptidoglycan/LPS O-acetylase OafA/YrhL
VSLFLGDISYSIYMVHWPLIVLAMHFAPSAWKWAVAASLIPAAALSFRYVELPSRRWGRHLAGALGRPAGLITAQSGPM